ncbi:hypothetical protein TELCIR_08796 [Teladorsagia circumcincta]|uniref:Uncharacterized protein n=1 Tax=Teladorsagia circumcincta TaxID=45464 RepID=A0A2G9UGK8_TELCI|nr:hypothetical protein TELCIR_08796 [Teladorsagia circumcincta]
MQTSPDPFTLSPSPNSSKDILDKKRMEPTNEEVDRVHRQYCEALTELFEEHKTQYGVSEDTRLILV